MGRQDSNLHLQESKSCGLPLAYAPVGQVMESSLGLQPTCSFQTVHVITFWRQNTTISSTVGSAQAPSISQIQDKAVNQKVPEKYPETKIKQSAQVESSSKSVSSNIPLYSFDLDSFHWAPFEFLILRYHIIPRGRFIKSNILNSGLTFKNSLGHPVPTIHNLPLIIQNNRTIKVSI